MSNGLNKTPTKQAVRSLSDRVGGLEQNVARALIGIQGRFEGFEGRLSPVEELVDALVDIQGRAEVERLVDERRIARARALAEQEKNTLEGGVRDGYVTAAEVVGEKSIIVGKYVNADGVVIEPGRAQLVIPGVAPQFREKLVGKGAGTVLDLPNDETFELLEIYEVDNEKYQKFVAEKQAAAVNEAAKAAGEAASAAEAEAQSQTGAPVNDDTDDSGPVQ